MEKKHGNYGIILEYTSTTRKYLRAHAVPPTPQEEGAATSDGTGGASGKESSCRSQTIFLRLA